MGIKNKGRKILVYIFFIAVLLGIGMYLGNKSNIISNIRNYIVYDDDELIEKALNKFEKTSKQSTIIQDINTKENVMALNFVGLSTPETNDKVIDLLKKYDKNGTFFVPGMLAAEDTEIFKRLQENNNVIGSNGLYGEKQVELKNTEEMIESFVRSNQIIKRWANINESILLYSNSTKYTNSVLKAAYVSGNNKVVESNHILNYRSFSSYEQTLSYIKKLLPGTIITIKLDGELDEIEYKVDEKDNQPAEDKKSTTEIQLNEEVSEEDRLLLVIEWIIRSLDECKSEVVLCEELPKYGEVRSFIDNVEINNDNNNYTYEIKDDGIEEDNLLEEMLDKISLNLRVENGGKKASSNGKIYTTEPAVAYSFYGLTNNEVLQEVLKNLKDENIKGTFFISERDIKDSEEKIKEIVDQGHELQIMLLESSGSDYLSISKSIMHIKNYIKEKYNQDASLVRYPYEKEYSDEVLEAISANKCYVSGQNLAVATSSVSKMATVADIMNTIFNEGNKTLHRGDVVYFRMDYYDDNNVIPQLLKKIKEEKVDNVGYSFSTLSKLSTNKLVYSYPLKEDSVLESVRGKIGVGHLANITNTLDYISSRYIGNPNISSVEGLPGFTQEEVNGLDKSGKFTDEKVIFLTFDDWGSDIAINKILSVLDKYNVKATFFIRTNYIGDNPNLVRTIGLAGHDIASHSDQHLTLSNVTATPGVFSELTNEEIKTLQQDVILSYEKLQSIVGDITVDGKKVLQTFFRPPTLAVSKKGIETILDTGFTYMISGDFSTQDYIANSKEELVDKMINGITTNPDHTFKIENGSVVVMHMSDEAKYTAEALDIVIPYYLSLGYEFGEISDYLQ